MQAHVRKVCPQKGKSISRVRARVKGSFFRKFITASLIYLMFFDAAAQAMVTPLLASGGGSSMPEFWMQEANVSTPDQAWSDMRTKVLNDESNRISPDFKIPESLRKRTEFWFDIYTRYGSNEHVIHHVLYPWIVYKVVDTTEMVETGKGPLWLRKQRAEKYVKGQIRVIRSALYRLARRHSYNHLTGLEEDLFEKLQAVPGPRRRVFRQAAFNVRKQLGQRDFFRSGLMNSSRYLPYMEEKFKELGLPVELTRMPFVESSFNEKAFSKAGASGIWQIMPRTGRAYMIVSRTIDERNSPIKATAMAARMLKQMYHSTKSWALTITSYNHGIGNLRVAIRRARSKDLATIIARYHRGDFKFASSNYYTCFLAALHAEKYNELVFNDLAREPLQEQEVVVLKHKTSVNRLQKITGLSRDQILSYNLDLKSALSRRTSMLPKGYQLHVPKGLATTQILGSHEVSKIRQTSI